jgi:hypothetical protein
MRGVFLQRRCSLRPRAPAAWKFWSAARSIVGVTVFGPGAARIKRWMHSWSESEHEGELDTVDPIARRYPAPIIPPSPLGERVTTSVIRSPWLAGPLAQPRSYRHWRISRGSEGLQASLYTVEPASFTQGSTSGLVLALPLELQFGLWTISFPTRCCGAGSDEVDRRRTMRGVPPNIAISRAVSITRMCN